MAPKAGAANEDAIGAVHHSRKVNTLLSPQTVDDSVDNRQGEASEPRRALCPTGCPENEQPRRLRSICRGLLQASRSRYRRYCVVIPIRSRFDAASQAAGMAARKGPICMRRNHGHRLMNLRKLRPGALLLSAFLCIGCAPVPVPLYVADASQGKAILSTCSINKGVPEGIEVALQGLQAQVKLVQAYSNGYLEVRLDVPPGMTVQLDDAAVTIDLGNRRPPLEVRYPNISLVDTPAVNSFNGSPALAKYMVPVRTPLVGGRMVIGRQVWNKHFWMAARLDTEGARDVSVTLPDLTINGLPVRFPALRFHRELFVVLAPFNC
ncbi:hypothetical protein WKW79_01605 [Variovorax robiniae]|uniref:Uncharacterized protein n=1 Tax=Variovorax robiniae TaxID=1836199 RepID=A0ABU8X0B9_9BURK